MLADLLNTPESPLDWQVWSHAHMIEHNNLIAKIAALNGPQLIQYQLDPIRLDFPADFFERNQHAHTDVNSVLNLNSSDLQDVDIKDQQQLIAWIKIHAQEHYDMNAKLGL